MVAKASTSLSEGRNKHAAGVVTSTDHAQRTGWPGRKNSESAGSGDKR